MDLKPLAFRSGLELYRRQAEELLAAFRAGHPEAIRCFHERHPRFLDPKVPWLPKPLADEEIRSTPLALADAQLALARRYDFRDWPALQEYVEAVTPANSPVALFESAVEAVITGNLNTLLTLIREHPELVHARSTRITHFDPPQHRATLLHYIAANGVEGYRQVTPKNAVEIAATLLRAGAAVDALAAMYGGECTTLSLLVSSCHPANVGVQGALAETLIDFGAALEPRGTGNWTTPVMTALAFNYLDTAEILVKRGAPVNDLALAAGLGRLADARRFLASADKETRQRALALAAQLGHADIIRLLLDAGEDPNRYNPAGLHAHATPLHHAALHGHATVVKLLVERGARLDLTDTIYQSTPTGWAAHAGHTEVATYLRSQEAGTRRGVTA